MKCVTYLLNRHASEYDISLLATTERTPLELLSLFPPFVIHFFIELILNGLSRMSLDIGTYL